MLILVFLVWAEACFAQEPASYTVEFRATWSAQSHPNDFPGNPHFSGLIGGTHRETVVFWEPGSLASPGIERMAETGSKSPLTEEVQAAIDAGDAEFILSGRGIGRSPSNVSLDFDVTADFPLVSLVSMVAPSPDWFVGVHGMSLLRDNGEWLALAEVVLSVYDAGTDSGTNYTSPDEDTDPPQSIALLTSAPFDQSGAVGTFLFRRRAVTATDAEAPTGWFISKPYPNPTTDWTRIDISGHVLDRIHVRMHDVTGRTVLVRTFSASGTDARIELPLGELAPGVYFLETKASDVRAQAIVVRR